MHIKRNSGLFDQMLKECQQEDYKEGVQFATAKNDK
jgi:hypothetical protein